jgi:CPA1 family monovalent cation:H+ antiporter
MCLAGLITGTFSFAEASFDFFAICIGGIAIGLIIGWITLKIINMIKDAALCCTVSLIIPYLSYFFADHLEMSGVLSAVTAGIIHGWFLPATLNPIIKLEMGAVWKMFVFLLNGAAFILIGLQLPMIINDIQNYDAYNLTIYAICLNLVVLIVRFFWVYLSIYLPSRINKNLSQSHPHFDWKNCLIISWCGMRGIVSLASALALPILINNEPFEDRSLIILLTFSVIFVTLVLQGLTLPFLIKKLNAYKGDEEGLEEIQIRLKTSEAAMEKIKELSKVAHINKDMLNQVKIKYEDKILSASTTLNNSTSSDDNSKISQYRNTQIELLLIERHKVINLRNKGAISFKVAKRILTDIDFEAARLINRFGEEED